MLSHVDQRGCFGDRPVRCFDHSGRGTYQGHHRAVGRLTGVHVEQSGTFNRPKGRRNFVNYCFAASLREVGNAFH